MVRVRPFAALRPSRKFVEEIVAYPSESAYSARCERVGEKSMLHITRADLDFDPAAGLCEDMVYRQAADNFCTWQERKWLVQDDRPHYYIHSFSYDGRTVCGFVLCVSLEDCKGVVTSSDSVSVGDRMKHRLVQNADLEPAVFSCDSVPALDAVATGVEGFAPEYDFKACDGVHHRFWVVNDKETEDRITEAFADVPAFSVVSGATLLAAASLDYGRRNGGKSAAGVECGYLMATCFPGGSAALDMDGTVSGGFTVHLLDESIQI